MRLIKLTIDRFKNLNDFVVEFDKEAFTTVLLGRNGTGKSNLLEALIIIFRDLDLGDLPSFKYQIEYLCRDHKVQIDADPQRRREPVSITIDDQRLSYRRFIQQEERRYLPSYVFGYYSGPSNKMEKHFEKHQEKFYRDLLQGVDKPLRPLIYAHDTHRQLALLSFFNEQDPQAIQFLDKRLGIIGIDSILFIMKQPPWTSKEGDPRFWNARGVVQHFLSELYDLSLAPLRLKRQTALGFNQRASLEHLYLYLPNRDGLEALYNIYGSQQGFFNALESTYMSSIISEVRTLIRIRNLDRPLTFQDLSEGEQQLLMVLGLLRFTKEDEALFLLDEPDTHLNPIWSIQYLELMKEVVGEQKSSHVIMSTHNPLVVASLEVPQIKIMQRDEETGRVTAEPPEESPRGMGIDGILTSDLFGLRSALDPPTQVMVDTRRELAVKDELSVDEHEKLEKLNKQLGEIDFSINARDNLYLRFVKEMTKRDPTGIRRQIELTPQQRRDQRKLILEILEELSQEERGDEAY